MGLGILQETSTCGGLGMRRPVQRAELRIYRGRRDAGTESDQEEGSFLPPMVDPSGECAEGIDDLSPVKRLGVWRGGIVLSEALQVDQGEGEELALQLHALEVEEVLLLVVWRDNKLSVPAGLLYQCQSFHVGDHGRTRCIQPLEWLSWHFGHDHRPLRVRHGRQWAAVIADGAAVNAEAQREGGIVVTATKTQILRSTDAGLGAGLSDVVGQAGGWGMIRGAKPRPPCGLKAPPLSSTAVGDMP